MKRIYINMALYILWRTLQTLVVIPASLIGVIILCLVLAGQTPIQDAVYSVYDWAETSVRPAPAGTILETVCRTTQKTEDPREIMQSRVCDSTPTKVVPAADVVAHMVDHLMIAYGFLVLVSFLGLFLVLPFHPFFGDRLLKRADDY